MDKREYTYNERSYQMLVPAVRQSMPLCNRVAVLLGPVVATLKQDSSGGMDAFGAAVRGLDPVALDALMMDTVKAAKLCFHGEPISDPATFERHFGQYRGDIYPVCLWCLWECVRDFFPQLGAFASKAMKAAEKAFQSQKDGSPIGGLGVPSGTECVPGPNSKMAL